jgi:thioredoxin reductase (NADPH)
MEKEIYDVAIIGAGPGGLTCGLYCSRAGLDAVVLDRGMPGGQMAMTERIDNYPGFPDGVAGMELGELMANQAKRFGTELAYGSVSGISASRDSEGLHEVRLDEGRARAKAVVIATGATPRRLGIAGETELLGRGVSYCAVCDGNFFKAQEVCVIGGGDAAVEEAVYLSKLCSKVTIVHRRDRLRAAQAVQAAAMAKPNIVLAWNSQPLAVAGADLVTGLKVRDVVSGEERVIPCSGVFFYIGITPETGCAAGAAALDERGFIKTNDEMETSVEGVYAVGDVRRPRDRQVATAVADGVTAALAIDRKINEHPERWR